MFFAALYGAPALLARELVRRAGWGWPSLLLLSATLGIAQACLIDQSLFSADYQGYDGWEVSRRAAFVPALSISANQAFNFIIGHVIFSFAAPIAIAEAWQPERATQPWLGRSGVIIAGFCYLAAALMILADPASHNASATQLAISAALVILCVLTAWRVGWRLPSRIARAGSRGPWRTFGILLVPALAFASDPLGENWGGLALNAAIATGIAAFVGWRAQRPGWGVQDAAAVALAFLFARGALAFTYFPLAGEVPPFAKYAHNIVMLAIILIAGWFALRRAGAPA